MVKVIETGTVVGFDFEEVDMEVAKEIARREMEDNTRFEDTSG